MLRWVKRCPDARNRSICLDIRSSIVHPCRRATWSTRLWTGSPSTTAPTSSRSTSASSSAFVSRSSRIKSSIVSSSQCANCPPHRVSSLTPKRPTSTPPRPSRGKRRFASSGAQCYGASVERSSWLPVAPHRHGFCVSAIRHWSTLSRCAPTA